MSKWRATRAITCFLLLIVALGLCSCTNEPDPGMEVGRIRGLIERTEAMNNDGDIEGWVRAS